MDNRRLARELVRLAKELVAGKADKAYEAMVELIEDGMDFAAAHERVVVDHRLSDAQARKLVEWYDEDY